MTTRPATFNERMAAAGYEVRKRVSTFAELQASAELSDWLPGALDSLAEVVGAALYSEAGDAQPSVEQRLAAVANSADEFKQALVGRVATAIKAEKRAAPVKKTGSKFTGIL